MSSPNVETAVGIERIGTEPWLRERFPDKRWHRHPRTDGRTDLCDGTPSDCAERTVLESVERAEEA